MPETPETPTPVDLEALELSYREATVEVGEDEEGNKFEYPVNSHDACMRVGARFMDVIPALIRAARAEKELREALRTVPPWERTPEIERLLSGLSASTEAGAGSEKE